MRQELPPGFGKWEIDSAPHSKARSELNPLYRGKRAAVGDEQVPWSVTYNEYSTLDFTYKTVVDNGRDKLTGGRWADPSDPLALRDEISQRITFENDGRILFGDDGRPRNPRGRTGLRGRGLLGQWGPNHAADPIVTRHEPLTGTFQVRYTCMHVHHMHMYMCMYVHSCMYI